MEDAQVKLLGVRQMSHTGHECLLERPVIGSFRKGSVDGGVVDGRLAMRVLGDGQALPLHPGIEDPQDQVKDAMVAQFALWAPLGHREVREDKCGELAIGQLHRDRRRYRLFCRCTHYGKASGEER